MIHPKGRHRSRPMIIKRVEKPLTLKVTFTSSCRYDVGLDQNDWNKLYGVKKRYLCPHQNSQMYAWRYNPGTDNIEWGIYWHDEDGRAYHPKIIRSVPLNREVIMKGIDMEGWLINAWFGGTSKAPQDVEIIVNFL